MNAVVVNVDKSDSVAIYKQIINSIISAIESGIVRKGDKIPSINEIASRFKLSRDTVLLAYSELKARGIITSMPGKGYYVESENVDVVQKVFLLFDELNAFKEELYNSFIEALPANFQVDIFFHHFNKGVFENLVKDSLTKYSSYVLMPGDLQDILSIVSFLPKEKVFILDQKKKELEELYPVVYQDFEGDIFQGLMEGESLLSEYSKLVLVYPGGKEPEGFVAGFSSFCKKYLYDFVVISTLKDYEITKGEVYVILRDKDLVKLIKESWSSNLKIGKDIGIVAINNYSLMEVVAGGITTISTDFVEMGKTLADMVMHRKKGAIKNPSSLIVRNSL